MSLKERKRMVVMAEVKAKKMSVREAAVIMGMGYRQAKRVWQRYRELGEAGLVHRARGKPGVQRRAEAERAQILARFGVRYLDFGPTLAAEYLRKDGLKVNHETLRRWLLEEGLRTVRRRGQQHRQWRERHACFGELVQWDGSHHDWFEGRRGSVPTPPPRYRTSRATPPPHPQPRGSKGWLVLTPHSSPSTGGPSPGPPPVPGLHVVETIPVPSGLVCSGSLPL